MAACILAPLTGRHGHGPLQRPDRWLAASVLLPPWQGQRHWGKTGLGTTSSVNFRILCKFGKTSDPTLINNERCPECWQRTATSVRRSGGETFDDHRKGSEHSQCQERKWRMKVALPSAERPVCVCALQLWRAFLSTTGLHTLHTDIALFMHNSDGATRLVWWWLSLHVADSLKYWLVSFPRV